MKTPEYYKGKEQTYLKHFFLEQYLETVAAHIGYAQGEFVYVDCFSGPWRAEHEDLADTSIRIALDKLNYVREMALAPHKRFPTIRAIFIEKDPIAFGALRDAVEQYRVSVKVSPLPGTFEDNIPAILAEVGARFSFCFVDPTGWTGLSMDRIQPLLRHQPGEVVINFMYDFINRFLNSHDPATEASIDRFFGTDAWRRLRDGPERETDIINLYAEQVRTTGKFPYVTSTRILKPLHDRAYFHLIYATRSSKGIEKFRDVDFAFAERDFSGFQVPLPPGHRRSFSARQTHDITPPVERALARLGCSTASTPQDWPPVPARAAVTQSGTRTSSHRITGRCGSGS
jgi:three-Cys-motif partner protein